MLAIRTVVVTDNRQKVVGEDAPGGIMLALAKE